MKKPALAMEIIVAAIRPKQNVVGQEFRPKFYDILVEAKGGDKQTRLLPKFGIGQDEEPRETTLIQLFLFTGGEHGGVRGERAVVVHKSGGDNSQNTRDPGQPASSSPTRTSLLFCVPVNRRDKLPRTSETLGFFPLDSVIDNINTGNWPVTSSMKASIKKLESWLLESHSKPKAIDCLFRSRTEYRIRLCINNPAFIPNTKPDQDVGKADVALKLTANEALAKMLFIEKCDKVVMNPLFGSGLPYKTKVDNVVDNRYWGLGRPRYEDIKPPSGTHLDSSDKEKQWEKDFPLHKCAYDDDIAGMKELLAKGYNHSQLDYNSKWAPIHYAAWCGHVKAVSLLLEAGCSPNIRNKNMSTPLHFAAMCGHPYVIIKLLDHRETDYAPVDTEGKTPLNYCEHVPKTDWLQCAYLLKTAKIQVTLMNGTCVWLNLEAGESTTVQQLNQQMLQVMKLPPTCSHLFTIWICSYSLELQLKLDHKPWQHLRDWKRVCVKLTDGSSNEEEPILVWRRDALLTPKQENAISHPAAINLMFHEAYHNYIKAMYPCSDNDVLLFAAILTYMSQGEYEQAKAKTFFSNGRNLQSLVPANKLKNRASNLHKLIHQQYKNFSSNLPEKDQTTQALEMAFLKWCRNLTVYGSAFFHGRIEQPGGRHQRPIKCLIGVNDVGLHLINAETRDMNRSFRYPDIEWQQIPERPILEIQPKSSQRTKTSVRTKQAGLITHLMTKMASLEQRAT